MKAVVCRNGQFTVEDLPALSPARGQVLLDVVRTGICGSDLHARSHADVVADLAAKAGYPDFMRSHQSVVLGHEFVGTVAEYGPGCRKRWPVGARVVALPTIKVSSDRSW